MEDKEFESAVSDYSNLVLRIAVSSLHHMEDAKDVTQDVFLKLYRHSSFKEEEHLKRWLIRVTYTTARDLHKKMYRKEVNLSEEMFPYLEEKLLDVRDELSRLSSEERVLIYLYYFEGYSYKEIAKILHKNMNTVSSKVQRSLKKLNLMMKEEKV